MASIKNTGNVALIGACMLAIPTAVLFTVPLAAPIAVVQGLLLLHDIMTTISYLLRLLIVLFLKSFM